MAALADRAGRFAVKFDDGSVMRLYRQVVEDYGLYPGLELTEDRLEKLRQDAGQVSAKMRAVRIVAAAGVSKKDLQQRLIRKGEDPAQAQEAVRWMEELHLVDDREVAAQLVARCVSKGYGAARAKQLLYEKQIPKALWDEALEDYPDQTEHILKFLRTRLTDVNDRTQVKKCVDALLRKGHKYGQIRSAMNRLGGDTEEFPEDF